MSSAHPHASAVLSPADAMKAAFRMHPAGVAIITAQTADGPVGLTASSVSSVAVDPPALSFSVTRATGSAGGILSADSYVVHLIDEEHADLAQKFAVSGAERFTPEQGWTESENGEPVLRDARARLRCRTLHAIPVGSSTVVIAEVLDVRLAEPGTPVVYLDRRFRSLPDPDQKTTEN